MELETFAAEMIAEMDAKPATQPESEQQPQEEPTPVLQAQDEQESDVEDQEEVVVEAKEEAEDSDESVSDEDEPWMPQNLQEMAEAFQVDVDDLKSIQLPTKVDGVEGVATLGDVLKNYQFDKSLSERSQNFAEEKKKFEESSAKLQQEYQDRIENAEAMVQVIEDQLRSEIGNIDWDQLRVDNPAEWGARRQEFMERVGQVEQAKQKILEDRQKDFHKQQEQFMKNHEAALAENSKRLVEAIPELKDPKVREEKLSSIKSYLRSQGVSDQELNTITDYRVIVMANKAMELDEMKAKAQPAKARAKTKPKFTKPSARKTKAAVAQDAIARKSKRLKQTGKAKDFASLLLDSGTV